MRRNTNGQSLELFFIDGKPDGMLTAKVFNWTGHVLMAPRTQISDALKRPESSFTGVYILIGEQDAKPTAYVGEGEDVSRRLKDHDAKKDWWDRAVLITSAANNLNKAHVKYLEARLVQEATEIGRVELENGNNPVQSGLTEADEANMEAFLDKLLMVLPAIRVDFLLQRTRSQRSKNVENTPALKFELNNSKQGIKAIAELDGGEFIVQAGSLARGEWIGKAYKESGYAQLHAELVKTGVLAESGALRVFTSNYAFNSTSAAAAVITGRSANGTVEWKVAGTSKTYKKWEAEQLS